MRISYLGVLNIKQIFNQQFVVRCVPALVGHVRAVSPHMIRISNTVTQLEEAGGAVSGIVQIKLLELYSDEVSVFRDDLPPAGDISSPVEPSPVQSGRAHTQTVPRKYFPAATHRALPGESG